MHPELARTEAFEVPRTMHRTIADQLRRGQPAPAVDVDLEASLLTALVPAVGQNVLDGSMRPERAFELIDYALARALPRCPATFRWGHRGAIACAGGPASARAACGRAERLGTVMSLTDEIGSVIAGSPGVFGVYARNLTTGAEVEVDADRVLPAESAAKSFILVYYSQLVASGAIDPTERASSSTMRTVTSGREF